MDRKMVNFIKEQYPPRTRIRLNSMDDPYHPILPGTEGEVNFVDDEGQIFMKWDNGRTLPLAPGEDSFTVLPPKLTTLKLYMPLTADLYERNEYGEFDDCSTLLEGRELRGYHDQITAALVKNRMPEEAERGLMHWYDEVDSVNTKVRTAVFTVEERDRQLWGVAECRVAGELSDTELENLKEYLTGQASDGWGEGFEQREISVDDGGELYVHLWNDALEKVRLQTDDILYIVPSNFRQVEAPRVDCKVLSKLTGGTQFVNTSDAGGVYNGQWIMATSRWVTRVYAPSKPLPRTGY